MVVLAGTERGEFLRENEGQKITDVADTDTREFEQQTAHEQEVVEDESNYEDIKYAAVKEEITRDSVKTEAWTGSESVEKFEEDDDKSLPVRLLDVIQADFSWPPGLEVPNFHRMRWRHGNRHMLEVRGNKSLFASLTEKCPEIPQSAAFSLEGTQVTMRRMLMVCQLLLVMVILIMTMM